MNRLKITLKQHTPLIHFQHDQDGATLRASEVKPKLDRFILNKLGNGTYKRGAEEARKRNWLVGINPNDNIEEGKQYALNYKMQINAINQKRDFLKDNNRNGIINPVYFGNMGRNVEPKHYSSSSSIDLTLKSLCIDFSKMITEKEICTFFLQSNFGTRKTKGLGSFYPTNFNNSPVTVPPGDCLFKCPLTIELESEEDKDVFLVIDYFWKWLKSGVNFNKYPYKDSILKLFISDKTGNVWEKPKIKEYFLNTGAHITNAFFYRAFLGLNDSFTYKWVPKRKQRPSEVYPLCDLSISVKCKDPNINRNPSPIIFSPYKTEKGKTIIYVQIDDSLLNKLKNKEFELSAKLKLKEIELITTYKKDDESLKTQILFFDRKFKTKEPLIEFANDVISKAKSELKRILNKKEKEQQEDSIEKAEDFVSLLSTSKNYPIRFSKHSIFTPNKAISISALLSYAKGQIKDNKFDVKRDDGTIINVKIL